MGCQIISSPICSHWANDNATVYHVTQTSKSGGRWEKQLLRENVNAWNAFNQRLVQSNINFKDNGSVHGENETKPTVSVLVPTIRSHSVSWKFSGFRENDESQRKVTCKECWEAESQHRKETLRIYTTTSNVTTDWSAFWQSYKDSLKPENVDRLLVLAKNQLAAEKGQCFILPLRTLRKHIYVSRHLVQGHDTHCCILRAVHTSVCGSDCFSLCSCDFLSHAVHFSSSTGTNDVPQTYFTTAMSMAQCLQCHVLGKLAKLISCLRKQLLSSRGFAWHQGDNQRCAFAVAFVYCPRI